MHFKCNELELYYNLPMVNQKESPFQKCPHIKNLICSRAKELAPDKCISERKCELYQFRDTLFTEHGIVGTELTKLNDLLRKV